MAQDRAVFWLGVALLLGVGIAVGQVTAVMIGAMTSLLLAYHVDGTWSG
jgi:hypothetical protein